ncbi:MAG TPA: efflux RND transporter permease subunit [Verrucomicrobiae bacterium]|nr:efflux RND transporter permease subunit [Verrucomicrobiae bacterium]
MRFTDFFIRRPVVATVVNLIILLAGLQAIRTLNIRQYPRSDIAVITVRTVYVGANADLVRGFITTPLERVIASADGIDYIESQSAQGLSTITVHLKINYDNNAALTQIQAKIAQVRNDLPPEAEAPVIDIETSDNQFAAAYLSFYSKDLDQNQITDYLTRVVQPKLTAVSGVQRADILGARTFAMRIWLKADRLAALNISPSEVRQALAANNYLSAVGATKGSMISVNLVANTDLRTAEEFRNLVVREKNGAIIRLRDVADVELGAESYDEDVRFSGEKATFMGVWVLPTANSLDVIRAVRAELPGIQRQLPAGMKVGVPYDSTEYINDALHEVTHTLIETLIIVIIVIFLFLGSVRSMVIPVVAIPISLIGAVFLMLVFGFTLNLLTLLAIVLSVGLVVDDAIVVVENVERHLHEGLSPYDAAIKGARELFGPIIAMTITLAAVYAPIGFQGGLTGALFREFALTLAGAVMVSGVVAITLSPMMSSKLLEEGASHHGFAGMINRHFDIVRRKYVQILANTLRWRPVTLTLAVIVILLMVPFAMLSQHELAPKEDQGVVFGIVQAAPNATIDQTGRFTEKINEVFESMPETEHTFQITQPGGGFSGMVTKPWSERKRTTEQILGDVSAKLASVPGVRIIPTTPAPLPGGGNFPVEFVIASTAEPQELLQFANKIVAKALQSGLFMFADTDLKFDQPQTEVVFDRDKVASLGLNLQQVGLDLGTMLGGDYVNRFSIQGRSYKVIPQITRVQRLNADQLNDIYVSGPGGKLVRLSTFATLKNTTEPRSIYRFQQLNSVTIQGAQSPGVTLDQALKVLEQEATRILPKGYTVDYAGEARQLRVEGNNLNTTLILSSILIFLVLAAQFESFRDPLIILLGSVPLALSGALLFTFLGFTTLNIYSQIGLITLVGLVSKNGILIVEFANKLQETGMAKLQAVIEAAGTRLRPILMTSAATIAGHFPLVLARGPGAGSRNSIGTVLVTGMAVGTLFTLFVVPAIYMLVARDHAARVRKAETEEALEESEVEHAAGVATVRSGVLLSAPREQP